MSEKYEAFLKHLPFGIPFQAFKIFRRLIPSISIVCLTHLYLHHVRNTSSCQSDWSDFDLLRCILWSEGIVKY